MVRPHIHHPLITSHPLSDTDSTTSTPTRQSDAISQRSGFSTPRSDATAEAVVVVRSAIANPAALPSANKIDWKTRLHDRQTASVTLDAQYELPPDVMFDLLADPRQHEKIFAAIQSADAELLEDDGPRRKWRLDYKATWSFWKVSGVCENRFWLWTDKEAGTVTFKLREPGFLRRYEGTWTIKPAASSKPLRSSADAAPVPSSAACSSSSSMSSSSSGGPWGGPLPPSGTAAAPLAAISLLHMQWGLRETLSNALTNFSGLGQHISSALTGGRSQELDGAAAAPQPFRSPFSRQQQRANSSSIHVETLSSPKITPPYPLNQILKVQAKGQVEDMLEGLVAAAASQLTVAPLKLT